MAGLQSLMQRGQMPGQAGSFSALPTQQGRSPQSYTASLKQLPPEELIRIYQDPNDLRPKWAVASAYADSMKAKALQQGVQGQQAMTQNAAEQQQPPVADALMARMAASGGEMKSYRFGGDIDDDIVASSNPEMMGGPDAAEEEQRAKQQEEQNERARIRQLIKLAKEANNQNLVNMYLKENPWLAQEQTTTSTNTESGTATPKPAGDSYSVKEISGGDNSSASTRTGISGLSSFSPGKYEKNLEDSTKKLMELRRKQADIDPQVQAARDVVKQTRATQLQQNEQDIGKIREGGVRQLQERLNASKRPIIEDPEALLALAGSISKKPGEVIGSLSSGAAKLLGERRARAEKAEEGISTLSEKIRLLNAQHQEAQAIENQRQLAILTNDIESKRNADIAAAQLEADMRKTQADIAIRMGGVEAERQKAQSSAGATEAARESADVQRLAIALGKRQQDYQAAKEAWLKGMPVKMAALKAESQTGSAEDVEKWNKMQKDFDNAFKNSPDIKNLDAAISRLGKLAGVPIPAQFSMRPAP